MNNMNTIALPRQTNVSENVRVTIKRIAANNGGLASLTRELGLPYKRTWERLNRNVGDLIDLVVGLAQKGKDDPLRIAVDATPYELTPKMRFLRTSNPPKRLSYQALDLVHACTFVTALIASADEDKGLSEREQANVKSALHILKIKVAETEARISGEGP